MISIGNGLQWGLKSFSLVELDVWYVCWAETKVNQSLNICERRLLIHLLTNRMFSKLTWSISFRMAFSLNKGLVCQFLGIKLIILKTFFLRFVRHLIEPRFCA